MTEPPRETVVEWQYDAVGNVVLERLANGNEVEHRYDGLDRLVASDDALGQLVRAEYDARGNRLVELDANGNRTEIDHDALDRIVERRLPGGLEGDGSAAPRIERFSWNVAGNQTSATDPRGFATRFAHDRLDRVVRETLPAVGTGLGGGDPPQVDEIVSTWDAVGNLLERTDALGRTTTFRSEVPGTS